MSTTPPFSQHFINGANIHMASFTNSEIADILAEVHGRNRIRSYHTLNVMDQPNSTQPPPQPDVDVEAAAVEFKLWDKLVESAPTALVDQVQVRTQPASVGGRFLNWKHVFNTPHVHLTEHLRSYDLFGATAGCCDEDGVNAIRSTAPQRVKRGGGPHHRVQP
jgi:hypothetical protein